MPLVSVCCAAYNQKEYIAETIEGLLLQETSFQYEILIHDDASTDGTKEIIESYAAKYPDKILPFYQEENQYSRGNKRIFALYLFPKCRGKYIAICEGDDYWIAKDKLQRQVSFLEENPDYSICFHDAFIAFDKKVSETRICDFNQPETSRLEDIVLRNFIPNVSVLYRKNKILENLPEWYMGLPLGDWPLHILTAQFGKIKYFNDVMSVYRMHSSSVWTARAGIPQLQAELKVYKNVNSYFNGQYEQQITAKIVEKISNYFEPLKSALRNSSLDSSLQFIRESIYSAPYNSEGEIDKMLSYYAGNEYELLAEQLIHLELPKKIVIPEKEFGVITEILKEARLPGRTNEHSLIDNFSSYELLEGTVKAPEIWPVSFNGKTLRSIFAPAKSRMLFNLPFGSPGTFEFGIMMHPEMWDTEEAAGGSSFQVIADDRISFEFVLDPVALPEDRKQFFYKLDIPDNGSGFHQILLETNWLGEKNIKRWCMWLEPKFKHL